MQYITVCTKKEAYTILFIASLLTAFEDDHFHFLRCLGISLIMKTANHFSA